MSAERGGGGPLAGEDEMRTERSGGQKTAVCRAREPCDPMPRARGATERFSWEALLPGNPTQPVARRTAGREGVCWTVLRDLGKRADSSPLGVGMAELGDGRWWAAGSGEAALGGQWCWEGEQACWGRPPTLLHRRHGDFMWAVGPGATREARRPSGLDSGGRLSWRQI